MSNETELIPIELADGSKIKVEAVSLGGEEDVSITIENFDTIASDITAIAEILNQSIQKISPDKAILEFGINVAVESGSLTTIFAKGSANASVKISLEWN
jgi:hypothetical protein